MSSENFNLLENATVNSSYGRDYNTSTDSSTYFYTEKRRGAGYYKNGSGIHTVVYQTNGFVGVIKIQGTLELYPGDNDWVEIHTETFALDSTNPDRSASIIGKFLFIRVAYHIEDGEILQVRYSC